MCGIVGLHLKRPDLEDRLGELLTPMLTALTGRGPDSAGIALYAGGLPAGTMRYSLRAPAEPDRAGHGVDWDGLAAKLGAQLDRAGHGVDWDGLAAKLGAQLDRAGHGVDWDGLAAKLGADLGTPVSLTDKGNVAILTAAGDPERFIDRLHAQQPDVTLVGYGQAMEIYKDVGDPHAICTAYGVDRGTGYQGVGHTRMATESAVTTDHSHPFAPAADLTLVHNGSFANHATIRRRLADQGVRFETDNDSEVAARYVDDRLRHGDDLGDALRRVLKEFDGFFTLLVATRTQFAVVRDAFACKPAVIAECADYVAMASEYHALAGLPGIEQAQVFEPMPEEVHVWSR